MNESKAKVSLGFIILVAAAAVSAVSLVLYRTAYSTNNNAYGFMIAAIVVAVIALAINATGKGGAIINWAAPVCAALYAAGLGWSLTSMVDAIGYVISGLFEFSTLQTYISFCIVAGISWLLYLVCGFMGIDKK